MSSVIIEELGPITIRALLRPMMQLCGFAVALGMVYVVDGLVRAMFGTATGAFGWIPYAGKVISSPLKSIEKKITGSLGNAERNLDNSMGAALYGLTTLVKRLAADVQAAAVFDWHLAQRLIARTNPAYLYHSLQHAFAKVRDIPAHAAAATAAALRPLTARFHALDQWTHARVRALEHSIGVAIPRDIAGLRSRTRSVEDGLEDAWKAIRKNTAALSGAAAVGLVAVALDTLGLAWTRCSKVGRFGRNACGMDDSLLEALLADTLLVLGTLSLVEFAEEMIGVTEVAVRPIQDFWRVS